MWIQKPYPNFHAARIKSPSAFVRIRVLDTLSNKILLYGGPLKTDPSGSTKIQSIRFPKDKFTVAEAKAWLKEHSYKPILFEPASKSVVELELERRAEETKKKNEELAKQNTKEFVTLMVKNEEERIVAGIVYAPESVDSQGDMAEEEEIRKACFHFMEKSGQIKVNHKGNVINAKVLENYIAPADFSISGRAIKKGTWLMTVRVRDDKAWEAIKSGELTGYSMAGMCQAEEIA